MTNIVNHLKSDIDTNKYIELLCSNDIEIRTTAIVDILFQNVAKNYPLEFYEIMKGFRSSNTVNISKDENYVDCLNRLIKLEEISGYVLADRVRLLSSKTNSLEYHMIELEHMLKNLLKDSKLSDNILYKLKNINGIHQF